MKKSRIIFGLGLALISGFAQAQNGLENIIVEKYYIANAADVAASGGKLATGSVTYRVYVDMLTGYKFQALYGDAAHALKVTTSTTFFNSPTTAGSSYIPNAFDPTVLNSGSGQDYLLALDSWFSIGAAADGHAGVLKSEDNGATNILSANTLLRNNAVKMGIPLYTQDGYIADATVQSPSFAGINLANGIFHKAPAGGSFISTNGAIASQTGVTGPTATNRVLIGQFTTDGIFRFELNIQIGTPTPGVSEKYVSSNPTGTERTISTLILEPNTPPLVSMTSPANNASIITGTSMTLTADASDLVDGSVTNVEFFVDGVFVGNDAVAPYTASYTAVAGPHTVYAIATDNSADADQTTSATRNFSVANNQAPTVSISAATTAIVGDVVTLSSTASDVDGTVSQVEFFVDDISVGLGAGSSGTYTLNWTATVGAHTIKAVAKDNLNLTATSSIANISVAANNPPTAAITSPLASATIIAGTTLAPVVVTFNATATDSDGFITGVEFFINNSSIGSGVRVGTTSAYTFDWTSTPGVKNITVKSTDNKGAITTSSVLTLNIADPNALPYEVVTVSQKCNTATFNVPVAAAATNTVNNVIGYDIVLNYDKTKVTPTGSITVLNNLINSTYVETQNTIDAVNGKMNIVLSFNTTAPANAKFSGIGNIFTVEFTKTANFASVDTALISVPFLQESYVTGVSTKAASTGKAITFKDYFFIGALKFWKGNGAINYNAASPNDHLITNVIGANVNTGALSANAAVQPDVNGTFSYDMRNGLAISINKDIASTTDLFGIYTGQDAAFGKLLLLNDPSFLPSIYQIIALDVNLDGTVSAGDISQMQQRTVLKIPEYKQAWNHDINGISNGTPSKDWMFVDSLRIKNNSAYQISATFPLNDNVGFSKSRVPVTPFTLPATVTDFNNCPAVTAETYKGILLGDVDGNLETTPNALVKGSVAVGDRLVFDFTRALINGTSVDVPVTIVSTTPVTSFDFQLTFDENHISFNETVVSNNVDGLGFYNTNDKTLRFTASNTTAIDVNSDLLVVRFDLSKGSISADDFTTYRALLNGKDANVELRTGALGLSSIKASENAVNIFPNPTTGILNVIAGENSTVEITDLTGKQVMFTSTLNANVKQEINVSDFSNGMYIVKVYNENFNSVERIVVNK
jgi:hypothetical protein